MASLASRQITATCDVRNPIPPEGASEADRSKLFELCGLLRSHQPGKDSLQARCRSAKLRGLYYTKDGEGNKRQILKNSESLIAQVLLAEGRASAVPAGWLQAAPMQQAYLDISSAMPVEAAAPRPVVHDMPSVPPPDAEAVQAAKAYFDQPLSYRNITVEHAMQKQVLEDSFLIGERFASSKDALTALMQLKQNIGGLSREDKKLFAAPRDATLMCSHVCSAILAVGSHIAKLLVCICKSFVSICIACIPSPNTRVS
ncbi:TPA: hypothetical protein ACH3X2_003759 [Trebouxia sp. C0005]